MYTHKKFKFEQKIITTKKNKKKRNTRIRESLVDDRAPRHHCSERAPRVGTNARAPLVCSSEYTFDFCSTFYSILFSFSGQQVCGWVNGRGVHIHMHVELVRLRFSKNKMWNNSLVSQV